MYGKGVGINPKCGTEAQQKIILNGQQALKVHLISVKPPSVQQYAGYPPITLGHINTIDHVNTETFKIVTDPTI